MKIFDFLYVHSNSFATKLIYNRRGTVIGIKYQKNGEEITAKVINDVIISAGALNSPGKIHKLLLYCF